MAKDLWVEETEDITYEANRIWANANVLRGTYMPDKYGDVIIPMTVLRRLECTFEPAKPTIIDALKQDPDRAAKALYRDAGMEFYCKSKLDLAELLNDSDNLAANFNEYLDGWSDNVQEIFDGLNLREHVKRMDQHNCLLPIVQNFAKMDLYPDHFDSSRMGGIFENLVGRFYSNVDAGQYYTPRDIVRVMVALGLAEGAEDTYDAGKVITIYDGTAGTAGMLTAAENYIKRYNPASVVKCYGQELMPQTYAVGLAELLIRGQGSLNYKRANTLMVDEWPNMSVRFVFMNPPFGTEWGGQGASDPDQEDAVIAEHEKKHSRWGAGLPKKNDSQLLFLQAAANKLADNGRMVIVENGSPLTNGDAGSGESEIRRWLLEEDLLEAIIAISPSSFVNTPIGVYLWVISKEKAEHRRGKVQLIDATEIRHQIHKNQGEKRYELTRADREEIVRLYTDFDDSDPRVKIFDYREFEYREYTVIQPMKRNYALSQERLDAMLAGKTLNGVWDEETISKLQAKDELTPREEKKLKNLMGGKPAYDAIVDALQSNVSGDVYDNPGDFEKVLKQVLADCDVTAALRCKIMDALSERDEDAVVQVDKKGNVVFDKETKDIERVPLLEDVDAYMEREVYPYVPDAHVTFDEDLAKKNPVIKTGAEIPFTRYFYKYQVPESPEDVLAEISELDLLAETWLQNLLDMLDGHGKNCIAVKDSNIPWIGNVPEDWDIEKVKGFLRRHEEKGHGDATVLSLYRDHGVIPKDSRDDNHNRTGKDTNDYKYVRKGDLVINKMKAWQGSLAVSEHEGIVSPAYFIYEFIGDRLSRGYADYLLRSTYKQEFERVSGGIRDGQWDLPRYDFEHMQLPLPSNAAQESIVEYLDACCAAIDSIIETRTKQLERLEDYRKALVFAYVTGKKEVPVA